MSGPDLYDLIMNYLNSMDYGELIIIKQKERIMIDIKNRDRVLVIESTKNFEEKT